MSGTGESQSSTRTVAVIPARGGSKGVPGKNLRVFNGRSLLARAIDCANQASVVDLVVVSTDDEHIAAEAEAAGATIVHRPPALATDTAPTAPAVVHAVDSLGLEGFDNVVLLQPPAPLRTGRDVEQAIILLSGAGSANGLAQIDSVVSVYKVGDSHPGRMYRLGHEGELRALFPAQEQLSRQDLPPVYHRNGAIYATRVASVLSSNSLLTGRIGAYVMDGRWTVNIDDPEDLIAAELIISRWDAEVGRRSADVGA